MSIQDEKPRSVLPQRLTFRDYFMLVNMVLFLTVGGVILYRSFVRRAPALAYLMGTVFLLAGGYRFYLFYKAIFGREMRFGGASEASRR